MLQLFKSQVLERHLDHHLLVALLVDDGREELEVVVDDRDEVVAQLDVELDHVGPVQRRVLHGPDRVFPDCGAAVRVKKE